MRRRSSISSLGAAPSSSRLPPRPPVSQEQRARPGAKFLPAPDCMTCRPCSLSSLAANAMSVTNHLLWSFAVQVVPDDATSAPQRQNATRCHRQRGSASSNARSNKAASASAHRPPRRRQSQVEQVRACWVGRHHDELHWDERRRALSATPLFKPLYVVLLSLLIFPSLPT